MISAWSMMFMGFTALVGMAVPVITFIYFYRKYQITWQLVLIGAGVYIFFVAVLEKFLHMYILTFNETTSAFLDNPYFYALYVGLAAAVFQETGRLLAMKLFMKNEWGWKHGITYGIGHGGIACLYIGGLVGLNNLWFSFLVNSGGITEESTQQMVHLKEQLIDMPSYMFAMSGLERLFLFAIQIGLSLLVFYAVRHSKIRFYFLALLFHTIIAGLPIIIEQVWGMNLVVVESFLLVTAILSVIFTIRSKRAFTTGTT